ncbi:ABC transporter permease, partial [Marinobacter pelagius]|nr:ABC transporter permease [Marinobacter sp. C7]
MIRYILKRLFGMIIVMFLVVTIVFVIVRVTPGDPAAVMLGPDATPQDIADLRSRLGLDQSILQQYVLYIG